jgi:hypothetical protein
VADGSGNGFDAKIRDVDFPTLAEYFGRGDLIDPGDISHDTTDPVRGAGAAKLTQNPNVGAGADPVYIDFQGEVINQNSPDSVPREAFTVAAWVNVTQNMQDQSVLQTASADGSFATHFQLQNSGQIRVQLRSQFQSDNIVSSNADPYTAHPWPNQAAIDEAIAMGQEPPAGEPYPFNEWFHVAVTYDSSDNHFAMFYNGEEIRAGAANGNAGNSEMGDWGGVFGHYVSAAIGGTANDGGRPFDGLVDEYYIFHRALSAEEIGTLANLAAPVIPGDTNGDGTVNFGDLTPFVQALQDPTAYQAAFPGLYPTSCDTNTDGACNFGDLTPFVTILQGGGSASANAVPEPASLVLLVTTLGMLLTRRRGVRS